MTQYDGLLSTCTSIGDLYNCKFSVVRFESHEESVTNVVKFYAHDYGTKMKRIFGVRADQGLELGGLWSRLYGDSMGVLGKMSRDP